MAALDPDPSPPKEGLSVTSVEPTGPSHRPFRSVLLALDRKDRDGFRGTSAWDVVRWTGARLTLCHVVMRPTAYASNEADGAPADAEERGILQTLRATAVTELGPAGRAVEIRILHGDVGQRICEFAEYLHADLIVMGPRQKGGLARALRGSVSRYVVANARVSVIVLGMSGHGPVSGSSDPVAPVSPRARID